MTMKKRHFASAGLVVLMALPACQGPVGPSTNPVVPGLDAPHQRSVLAAETRSIEEFLDAQGTYCIDDGNGGCVQFVPPIANFVGFSAPATNRGASFDYAGLANQWIEEVSGGQTSFGTTFSGSVTEHELPDGRALVHVVLHTRNAVVWVIEGSTYATDPLLFGHRPMDVYYDGEPPALGDSTLNLKFINPTLGAPLPDLEEVLFARITDLVFLSFEGRATGELHAGSGYPEGTPGRLKVSETAPIGTAFRNGFKGALGDGFPTENITLRAIGTN